MEKKMKPKILNLVLFVPTSGLLLTACSTAVEGSHLHLNTIPIPARGLYIGLVLVLAFLLGFWSFFHRRPVERLSAFQSTLFLACLFIPLRFIGLVLHEGGHALYHLVRGSGFSLFVHPFAFSGYSRPMVDFSVWTHISGSAVAIPAALLIFLLFWKQRSLATLPILMLFPWVAINDGMYMLQRQGDYHNLLQVTRLPDFVLIGLGSLIACIGLVLFFSLLPLLGLPPQGRKPILIIPAAMFLWAFSSMLVAHLVVPVSPFAIQNDLVWEIVPPTNEYFINAGMGMLFAVLYLTLYRWLRPLLPAGLRMETIDLSWKNLRLPGFFFTASVILGLIIILGLAACSSASSPSNPPTPMPAGFSGMLSGRVDVGGYELYYKCLGEGSPTAILEAGGPDDSSTWDLVMLYYREAARICAYDRANLGQSDSAPKPRTFQDMTRDLHILLEKAPIEGPYILVGHSMGGMLVRLYADQYPQDVAGLVLVDSAHPEMGERLLANLPPQAAGETKILKAWRYYGTWLSTSDGRAKTDVEGVDMQISNSQVRTVASLGDLPLVVITRSPDNLVLAQQMPPLPEEINARLLRMWQDLQMELVGLSSNSTQVIADHAGHIINQEEPLLVVDAILKLVNEYRSLHGEPITIASSTGLTGNVDHKPVILNVTEQREKIKGFWLIHKDIKFTDPEGDAITLENRLVSATRPGSVIDDIVRTPAEEQKGEALVRSTWGCSAPNHFVIEYRVFDKAGNLSEPVTATVDCP
jgi:pimeloyl-ACP methyl ester carboxylesterase